MKDLQELKEVLVNKEKLARIKKEKQKLNQQFAKIEPGKKKIVNSLIENAAFMIVTLEDLQEQINNNGAVSVYQNGENQWGTKKSPEIDIYNTMIKNHLAVVKQLAEMAPKGSEDDGFEDFLNQR